MKGVVSPVVVFLAAGALLLPRSVAAACPADCDGDGRTAVPELIRAVRIALELDSVSVCPAADANLDQQVAINELIQAVGASLEGCPDPIGFDGPVAFGTRPSEPLVLEAPLDDGRTITLYGALDAAGLPARITSAVVRSPDETVRTSFDVSDRLEHVHVEGPSGEPMGRFDLTWITADRVRVDYTDMGTLGLELPLRTSTIVDVPGGGAAAASTASASAVASPAGAAPEAPPPEILPITVRDCDDRPIGDVADVRLRATWRAPGGQVTDAALLDAEELLPGDFRVRMPVRPVELPPDVEATRQHCHDFADVVIRTCAASDEILSQAFETCTALHFAAAWAAAAGGIAAPVVSIPACVLALTATRNFCLLTQTPLDPLHERCELLYLPNQIQATAFERFFGDTVDLVPEVVFDNGLVELGPAQTVPAIAPATSFDFLVGTPQILDVRTEPRLPARGSDYQVVAELSCIPSGSTVFLSARDPDRAGVPPRRLIQSFEGSGALCLGVPSTGPGEPAGGFHESIVRVTGPGLPGGDELSAQRAIRFEE